MPDTTKNMVINKPTSEKLNPKLLMKTGNINGNSRWEKWELACAMPTNPMTVASSRQGLETKFVVVIGGRNKTQQVRRELS
jgi:hypothetical protein